MAITLYGVTSDGTSVPIEVTDDGKLVVDTSSLEDYVKEGDDVEFNEIKCAHRVRCGGSAVDSGEPLNYGVTAYANSAADDDSNNAAVTALQQDANGRNWCGTDTAGKATSEIFSDGSITAAGNIVTGGNTIYSTYGIDIDAGSASGNALAVHKDGSGTTFKVDSSGSITGAGGKCGFLSTGELIFYSRGERYKAIYQGGNMMAEPYTRQMALRDKAEAMRTPRPNTQDIVPED